MGPTDDDVDRGMIRTSSCVLQDDARPHHREDTVQILARTAIATAGLAVVLAACGAATDADEPGADEPDTAEVATDPADEVERDEGPGIREGFYWDLDEEPSSTIPISEIVSGGPPPDGIPPIDDPVYESFDDAAEWLTDDSPVMVVRGEGETKVFPLAIMTWHEIVNDSIDGEPIVVTYCPLCNSGLAFSAEIDGQVLAFGTSGRLWRSNLVMYDRQYGNLWTQFTGESIVGERFLGQELDRLPTTLQGFAEVRATDPDADVLSRETGHSRSYGTNPYTGYDGVDNEPFLFRDDADGRFPAMTRVVGFPDGDGTAVLLDRVREARVVAFEDEEHPVTLWWVPGQASALDTGTIDDGRDVGQTAAFVAELDGQTLTFEPLEAAEAEADGVARFRDTQTGSGWSLAGRAVEGDLEGESLRAVPIDDTFWFVWAVFKPDTDIIS